MQKQTVIFEENPKWRIYKGKCFCQIGPLSRDRARILYLIIIWEEPWVRQKHWVRSWDQLEAILRPTGRRACDPKELGSI